MSHSKGAFFLFHTWVCVALKSLHNDFIYIRTQKIIMTIDMAFQLVKEAHALRAAFHNDGAFFTCAPESKQFKYKATLMAPKHPTHKVRKRF